MDTFLKTEDGTVFPVNSKLLARHSKFFNSLFLMSEEAGQTTILHTIKPDIFKTILTYMSTGYLELTSDNVMPLLLASDFLLMESLLDKCKNFALENKEGEHALRFFLTASRIKEFGIVNRCRRLLVLCFERAIRHSMEEACWLSYRDLKYFLSHKSLNVSREHTIWSVIEAWVQKDHVSRLSHVPGLLRCLKVPEIDNELALNIISSPLIRLNEFYKAIGDPLVTMSFLSNKLKAQTVILFRNEPFDITEVRLPPSLHVVARNFCDGAELFLSYDDSLESWRKVTDTSVECDGLLLSGHSVYYLEHIEEGHYELIGFYYDLLRNVETPMAKPAFGYYFVGEVGGNVYALERAGRMIQRYDHGTDTWSDVRPSGYRVSGAVNVGGWLYVLSETTNGNMIMQGFSSENQLWWVRPPTVRRNDARSVVYQSKIFLVAGLIYDNVDEDLFIPNEGNFDEGNVLISRDVEVYDPQTDEWAVYPELPFRFFPVFLSVVKDRLYVYQDPRRPVVYWDGSGEWKIARNPSQVFTHKFCSVENRDVVRRIMEVNKKVDPAVWQESGLEKECRWR